jgi:hypothetical protein
MSSWAGFIWLRMTGSCALGNETSSSIKVRDISIGERLFVSELHGVRSQKHENERNSVRTTYLQSVNFLISEHSVTT